MKKQASVHDLQSQVAAIQARLQAEKDNLGPAILAGGDAKALTLTIRDDEDELRGLLATIDAIEAAESLAKDQAQDQAKEAQKAEAARLRAELPGLEKKVGQALLTLLDCLEQLNAQQERIAWGMAKTFRAALVEACRTELEMLRQTRPELIGLPPLRSATETIRDERIREAQRTVEAAQTLLNRLKNATYEARATETQKDLAEYTLKQARQRLTELENF